MTGVVDFTSPKEKAEFLASARRLEGRWRVEFVRYRPRRTDRQNAYYWPCFVEPFADYLNVDPEVAHKILRGKFLRTQVTDQKTGQRFTFVVSSASLDTAHFNEYLDKCAAMLAEVGIVVPEPCDYRQPVEAA